MWTFARRRQTFKTKPVSRHLIGDLNASQVGVPGFDLEKYQAAHVVLVGCGGIGSHVGHALVRKGIGKLTLIDGDHVELKNLTRQIFSRDDEGQPKALALARSLAREGLFETKITYQSVRLQELLSEGWKPLAGSILIAGVDNNRTRRLVAELGVEHELPVIHAAVARDGSALYVMVQEVGKACWACAFPQFQNDLSAPCGLPGIIDVLQVTAGYIVYSVDNLVSGRERAWTVRETRLDGCLPEKLRKLERVEGCKVCAGDQDAKDVA